MIKVKNGRAHSVRSKEDLLAELQRDISKLNPDELETFKLLMEELQQPSIPKGERILDVLSDAEYERIPVDIETFVKDEYYLGNTCAGIYPKWLEALIELFSGGYNEAIFCLHPDTPVPLLDGTTETIQALSDRWEANPEPFWVYGVKPDGEMVPALAEAPRCTGEDDYYEVVLDDGTAFTGNARHRMVLLTGEKRMIQDMQPGDSLMPFVTKLSSKSEGRRIEGYELIRCNRTGKWIYTHSVSAGPTDPRRQVIHHENFNKRDNRPVNLTKLGNREHIKLHQRSRLEYLAANPEVLDALAERQRAYATDPESSMRQGHLTWVRSKVGQRVALANLKKWQPEPGEMSQRGAEGASKRWEGAGSQAQREAAAERMREQNRGGQAVRAGRRSWAVRSEESRQRHSERLRDRNQSCRQDVTLEAVLEAVRTGACTSEAVATRLGCSRTRVYSVLEKSGVDKHTLFPKRNRHVVSIRKVGNGPVFCMTVPETTTFAICTQNADGTFARSGVYSSNTGAIGTGKTFAASIGACRILYELSCLRDPCKTFGLAPGSTISIANMSINELLARKVVFENLGAKIKASPYFSEYFEPEETQKEMRFPKGIWLTARATTDHSVLGMNLIAAILDECVTGDTLVRTPDGEVRAEDLFSQGGSTRVCTYDFEAMAPVVADAMIKQSTVQECFELELSSGEVLRASHKHPVAVVENGVLDFNLMRDILPGQEVVTYASEGTEAIRGSQEEAQRSCQEAEGEVQPVSRAEAHRRGEGEDGRSPQEASGVEAHRNDQGEDACSGEGQAEVGGAEAQAVRNDEASDRRREDRSALPDVGGTGQPDVRQEVDAGAERSHRRRQPGEAPYGRGQVSNECCSVREADAYRGVQAGVVRAEQDARVLPFRRIASQDQRIERLEDQEGELEVSWLGRDNEDTEVEVWVPVAVGAESYRVVRVRSFRQDLPVRVVLSAVPVGGEATSHGSGLLGGDGRRNDQSGGSEAARFHVQREGEGEAGGRSSALSGTRLDLRGVGRALSVGRVVSKKSLGALPTYDLCVPGYEVFVADGVLVHNTNFMHKKEGKRTSDGRRYGMIDQAETIYTSMKRRMKSRFARGGKLPGMLFVVSSKQTNDDFTARRIIESMNDPSVLVRDFSLWDVKSSHYSDKKFFVLCGNESVPSRVLDEGEESRYSGELLPESCVLIEVPEDFRTDFESRLEESIRDIAGVATVSVNPFIQRRDKIASAMENEREHPFTVVIYDPSRGGSFMWDRLVETKMVRGPSGMREPAWKPLVNPDAPRHVHIDPSLRGDSTGLCMSHICGYKQVIRRTEDGRQFAERAPVYYVDLVLQIVPPVGGEIVLGDLRHLVYDLSAHGFMVTRVSLDSWQSADTIQQLKQRGYRSEVLSVDITPDPYDNLKTALYEDRVQLYNYPPLRKELETLQEDRRGRRRKIDHPPTGSKDCSDALAGCLYTLSQRSINEPLPIIQHSAYAQDPWMPEQHQAALAGMLEARVNETLPPIMFGASGDDSWVLGGGRKQ